MYEHVKTEETGEGVSHLKYLFKATDHLTSGRFRCTKKVTKKVISQELGFSHVVQDLTSRPVGTPVFLQWSILFMMICSKTAY